jgi:hypothetical protein
VEGNCGRPPADGAAVRLRRTAAKADVRGIVGRVRTSGRVTTLSRMPSPRNGWI